MTLINSKYVYICIKVYENDKCTLFVNWNSSKQKHMVGHFSNIFLGQCRISAVIAKVVIFTPMSHLHQPAPLATEEGLNWSYTSVGTSSHSAPVFPVQSSAWWTDCSPAKDFRNWEFRLVKAALMLSGMCHLFSEEPGGQQGSGVPDTASSLALCDAVLWGKGDRRRMPRYSSDGDKLSRLWVFVLLALAQWVPSWSCTPGARVLGRNAQVLLHLAQQILNESVCLCETRGHTQHGCTSCTVSGGAGSSQHFSQQEFCLLAAPAPPPAGCWFCTLVLHTGSILQAELCFCPRTNCRRLLLRGQADYKPGTRTFLKWHMIPSAFPRPHLSVQELCRAGLSGSWNWTIICWAALASVATPAGCTTHQKHGCSVMTPCGWLLSVSQHLCISGC